MDLYNNHRYVTKQHAVDQVILTAKILDAERQREEEP